VLYGLRIAGKPDQVQALLDLDPARHAALGDPQAVARLLEELHLNTDAGRQVTKLAQAAAEGASPDNPETIAILLRAIREAGADEQVRILLAKDPARHARLDDPLAVARLLEELQRAGNPDQVTRLAKRAAEHMPLHNPKALGTLLRVLKEAGATEQAEELLKRNPASRLDLDDPDAVAELLRDFKDMEAPQQFADLAQRVTAYLPAVTAEARSGLLETLQSAGIGEQAAARLLRRAKRESSGGKLLWSLVFEWAPGFGEQTAALIQRIADNIPNDIPGTVAKVLDRRRWQDKDIFNALAPRAVEQMPLHDPQAVRLLLRAMREARATELTRKLLERGPADCVSLNEPITVTWLLDELNGQDPGQVAALAWRAAAHLQLHDLDSVYALWARLEQTDSHEQLIALKRRLPDAGFFGPTQTGENWFGRESDGSTAAPWTWDDLVSAP
jgi:uncharacterized protein YidB (DUF937 family)